MKHNKTKNNKKPKNKTKKQFLFNPTNPEKSFDVYIDKDPTDTIHIKYTTIEDVENTIDKLEKLYLWTFKFAQKYELNIMINYIKNIYHIILNYER